MKTKSAHFDLNTIKLSLNKKQGSFWSFWAWTLFHSEGRDYFHFVNSSIFLKYFKEIIPNFNHVTESNTWIVLWTAFSNSWSLGKKSFVSVDHYSHLSTRNLFKNGGIPLLVEVCAGTRSHALYFSHLSALIFLYYNTYINMC